MLDGHVRCKWASSSLPIARKMFVELDSGEPLMSAQEAIAARFDGLSVLRQSCLIVVAAVIGADLLTLIFYSVFFSDRLLLDLALTSLIAIVVSFPLSYFFMRRNRKFAELARELTRANRIDDLTGLLTRRTFLLDAKRLIAAADRRSAGALLFIDADHFKSVNDTFGHAMGDAVLRKLGAALKSNVNECDLVGRLGGEEFAVFLASAGEERTSLVCECIRLQAKSVCGAIGIAHEITVSIGASMHQPKQELDLLLIAADRNLYLAKSRGRDRTVQSESERAALIMGNSFVREA